MVFSPPLFSIVVEQYRPIRARFLGQRTMSWFSAVPLASDSSYKFQLGGTLSVRVNQRKRLSLSSKVQRLRGFSPVHEVASCPVGRSRFSFCNGIPDIYKVGTLHKPVLSYRRLGVRMSNALRSHHHVLVGLSPSTLQCLDIFFLGMFSLESLLHTLLSVGYEFGNRRRLNSDQQMEQAGFDKKPRGRKTSPQALPDRQGLSASEKLTKSNFEILRPRLITKLRNDYVSTQTPRQRNALTGQITRGRT